jgi:hypothetical protein
MWHSSEIFCCRRIEYTDSESIARRGGYDLLTALKDGEEVNDEKWPYGDDFSSVEAVSMNDRIVDAIDAW